MGANLPTSRNLVHRKKPSSPARSMQGCTSVLASPASSSDDTSKYLWRNFPPTSFTPGLSLKSYASNGVGFTPYPCFATSTASNATLSGVFISRLVFPLIKVNTGLGSNCWWTVKRWTIPTGRPNTFSLRETFLSLVASRNKVDPSLALEEL